MAPGAHILHTSRSSSNELKKCHANPVEIFCKVDETLNFDLLWLYLC